MRKALPAFGCVVFLMLAPQTALFAKDIKVAVGLSLPPYVIQETGRGFELDVVRTVLANIGFTLVPVYVPFARVPIAMRDKIVDAAMTVQESSGIQGAYSDVHIEYHNVAISLAPSMAVVNNIEDLSHYRVEAFQNAHIYLGDRFMAAVRKAKSYTEHAREVEENILLYAGRTDIIILDKYIFKFHNAEAAKIGVNINQPIVIHEIFTPTPYKVVFRDPSIRDAFNKGLAQLRKSGGYGKIMKSYLGKN